MLLDILFLFLFSVAIIIGGLAIEEDHWFVGMVLTAAAIWGISWHYGFHPVAWALANKGLALRYAAGYVVVGIVWSAMKFNISVNNIDDDDVEDLVTSGEVRESKFRRLFAKVPTWIAFWPHSILWDMLSTWLKSFFEWIAERFEWVYRKMYEGVLIRRAEAIQKKLHDQEEFKRNKAGGNKK